jgi:hypothetical protein
MGPTILSNEGSTVGIKTGLAPLSPVIEEDDTVRIGLVGSDRDTIGGGSALGELKGGEGGSLEPVGDGSDMLHSNGFNRHGHTFLSTHTPYQFL